MRRLSRRHVLPAQRDGDADAVPAQHVWCVRWRVSRCAMHVLMRAVAAPGVTLGATAVKSCVWCPAFFLNSSVGAHTPLNCTYVPQSAGRRGASARLARALLVALAVAAWLQ